MLRFGKKNQNLFEKEDKMKKTFIGGLIFLLIGIFTATLPAFAGSQVTSDVIPVPPSVAGLPTITSEPWVQIEPDPAPFLEGPSFDKEGNLFVVSVFDGRIFKITPNKTVSTIFSKKGLMPCGSAVHKDGRLFVVSLTGEVIVMNRDGSNPVDLTAKYQGKPKRPNDLVFDSKGNFYVTDWVGIVPSPTGGVYRFSSDLKTVQPDPIPQEKYPQSPDRSEYLDRILSPPRPLELYRPFGKHA